MQPQEEHAHPKHTHLVHRVCAVYSVQHTLQMTYHKKQPVISSVGPGVLHFISVSMLVLQMTPGRSESDGKML